MFDPSEADLAAIEAEWPVIEAELAVVAAECRLAVDPRCALARHAWRRAVKRLGSVAQSVAHSIPDPMLAA